MDRDIQVFQEEHGVEILVPSELIGNPFSRFACVIEVEHGRHGIHPQAVDVVAVQPEECTVHEKVAHFDPSVIENAAMPFRMVAETWVGMVIEMCSVEL